MFAGMTLAINIVMHDFWNVYEGLSQAHETQNFIKNLAIMAGLLVLGSNRALSPFKPGRQKRDQLGLVIAKAIINVAKGSIHLLNAAIEASVGMKNAFVCAYKGIDPTGFTTLVKHCFAAYLL